MNPAQLRKSIEQWTVQHNGWDAGRGPYLGMSRIDRCPTHLYRELLGPNGHGTGAQNLAGYEGMLHQLDLVARLDAMGIFHYAPELIAPWDERFRGHPNGIVDGAVLCIQTLTLDTFCNIRAYSRYPRQSDYMRVQCYMHYGGYRDGLVIYKCRETGDLYVAGIRPNPTVQAELEAKARSILAAVDTGRPPACTCGRCQP